MLNGSIGRKRLKGVGFFVAIAAQRRSTTMEDEEPERCMSISDLTDDLLMEIFVRLPCKSASRCMSVSKRWFAIISNPCFSLSFRRHYKTRHYPYSIINEYFFISKQVLLITFRTPEVDISVTPSILPCFQTPQEEEGACVVGSSEGLLLCCSTRDNQKIYYVCNLLTKRWVVLPPNPSYQEQQEVRIGFICNHLEHKSRCIYEVVLLTEFLESKSQIKVESFSSETGQWTKFVVSCPHDIEINLRGSAIAYKQKLHWFVPSENKILVYHPAHHKVHAIIDGPEGAEPLLGSQYFGMCCGSAGIARLRTPQCSLSIWRLSYSTDKWILMRQIDLKELTWKDKSPLPEWANISALQKANVLAFHPCADIVHLGLSKRIVSCKLRTKTMKLACKRPYELPLQALAHLLPTWPTPVPALPPQDALPRSRREADGAEVEDGEVRAADVEAVMAERDADMATRRISFWCRFWFCFPLFSL